MIQRKIIRGSDLLIYGEPKGDSIIINNILLKILSKEDLIDLAYNLVIEFKSEKGKRLGLFLGCEKITQETTQRITEFCLDHIGDIDIFYLKDLSLIIQQEIKNNYPPFYKKK